MELNKPTIVPSSNCVDTQVQTDTPPIVELTSRNSVLVQTEPSLELIAPQTPNANGFHSHPLDEDELVVKLVSSQIALNAEAVTIASPSTEFVDDIALLTNPSAQREDELITMKEQCSQLADDNRELTLRLNQMSRRSDVAQINSSIMWILAVLILIIACLLVVLCF